MSAELEILPAALPETPKVSVGPTSLAGWGATAAGVVGMVLVLVLHVDQEEAALIATSAMTVVAFVVTQVGRFTQAKELAKGAAEAHKLTAIRAASPPRMIGSVGETSGSGPAMMTGDPDHPLREAPLDDDELRAIVGPDVVEDDAADADEPASPRPRRSPGRLDEDPQA